MRFSTIIILTALAFSTSVFGETQGQRKTKPKAEPLSKQELLDIGEKYLEAVEACSGTEMESLFSNPKEIEFFAGRLRAVTEKRWVKSALVRESSVWLQSEVKAIPYFNPNNRTGYTLDIIKHDGRGIDIYAHSYLDIWLMVTPEGKIKYDSFRCKHPLQIAERCIKYLDHWYRYYVESLEEGDDWEPRTPHIPKAIEAVPQVYQQLKDLGVPLYEFDLFSSEREYEKAIRKTKRWLIKQGKEWDVSEPKVYIPDDLYKSIKKRLSH